jgi:hypothetical protein
MVSNFSPSNFWKAVDETFRLPRIHSGDARNACSNHFSVNMPLNFLATLQRFPSCPSFTSKAITVNERKPRNAATGWNSDCPWRLPQFNPGFGLRCHFSRAAGWHGA